MANTLTLVKKSNFYQDIVIKFLSKMEKGSLYLTLPDGEQISIGNGEVNITANIVVNSDEFYKRVILFGDIGFGEAGDGIFLKRQSPLILLILFANSSHYKNIFN